jgi:GABA(A) receptor-associated protein
MDAILGIFDMVYTGIDKVVEIVNRDEPTNSNDLPPAKNSLEFQKRKAETERLISKYPDRLPVIVITHSNLTIDKSKFLVPGDLTFGQLMYTINKRLQMTRSNMVTPDTALYGMVGRVMVPCSKLLCTLYNEEVYGDGMLYVHVYKENTFG